MVHLGCHNGMQGTVSELSSILASSGTHSQNPQQKVSKTFFSHKYPTLFLELDRGPKQIRALSLAHHIARTRCNVIAF